MYGKVEWPRKPDVDTCDGKDAAKILIPLSVIKNLHRARNASEFFYLGGGFPRNSSLYFQVMVEPKVALGEVAGAVARHDLHHLL